MNDADKLRVASYNIRKAIGGDYKRNPARVETVIGSLGADIVALQEGDYRFRGRAALFEPEALYASTGMRVIDLDNRSPGLGWHGNILMVGPDVKIERVRTIDLPGLEPRGAVTVHLDVHGRPLQVIAAHLGLFARNRKLQAATLVQAIDPSDDVPVIVMGDFNGWGRAPRSLLPFQEALAEVSCGPSYPASRPITPLDRLFYGGPLVPTASGVWRDDPARMASDHLPIWAEFRHDD
ncbi:endonuclease/exonuclease/phosphatase family protein [Jannaschia rubra]|uniref:Endonuclease/Exonuclease/phosphatase family protein n=1 Tax=Jannaschia rubra TaxID=282197 RepID=A0A0M6XNV5_9RHOB|nr:endonuclease/exonuclease/phosphatase family protein [Jannaschia rubra]CTQ32277.1 Endonuclease/Exonuclease/phosphatase family protein [Jannaschia rubra]SFG48369.1 Metal-dependent hydrolase, endonuclease/exonuclease/phosphatase family [Jannaschia rubra]